jgi:LmbE family N-acetylglucosaminyl deacetylase
MNIVVIAPHPDDESIGCGGTVQLHRNKGDRVVAVFLTSGELGLKHLPPARAREIREREAQKAAKILGIAKLEFLRQPDWYLGDHVAKAAAALRPILVREWPEIIYLPHPQEWHPDHQASLPIVQRALRRSGLKPQLLGYEIWTPLTTHDIAKDISRVMKSKLRAVRAHASQFTEIDYAAAISGLNQYRGIIACRCAFAEVFQMLSLR